MIEQPSFGRRLRQLRRQQGKAQSELAGPGMSAAYLSRLESGARPPTQRAVQYLASRLNVTLDAFSTNEPSSLVDVLAAVQASAADEPELRARLQTALAAAGTEDPGLRWQAHAHLASLLSDEGGRQEASEHLRMLVLLSDELRHTSLQVHSRLRLARCLRALGHVEEARAVAREGLRLGDEMAWVGPDLLRCRLLVASVTAELGDLAEALRLSQEACDSLRNRTGPLAAEALWTMATLSSRQGDHERSAVCMRQAASVLDSRDDLLLWMRLRLAAAALVLRAVPQDLAEAERHLDEVRPALGLVGSVLHEYEYAFLRAQLAYGRGDFSEAGSLCAVAAEGEDHLNFRDQILLGMLQEQIRIKETGDAGGGHLGDLAAAAQRQGMLDLAAEIWRVLAEARA
ncbi:helix-turn-helix domain-containing protein [Streptomyces sp. NPDC048111]|uniref:helix-turn-helix domain-containing protein n=1 Tax=Streptomyces sp. NPDC048111 TaxID=3365500 RepID=UPI00371AB64B